LYLRSMNDGIDVGHERNPLIWCRHIVSKFIVVVISILILVYTVNDRARL
jgi:hypothetical protein